MNGRTPTALGPIPARTAMSARLALNPLAAPGAFHPCRATANQPPGLMGQEQSIDAETVIVRLQEAGQTLLSLPNTGHSTALRQTRHEFLAAAAAEFCDTLDQRPRIATPPAARITRMDQALAWIPLIPADRVVLRRIVGCRCLVSPLTERHLFTWRRLARLLGADHKAIQRWHATGIDVIVATLNRDAAFARTWDTLG